jgi:hypothetical protein
MVRKWACKYLADGGHAQACPNHEFDLAVQELAELDQQIVDLAAQGRPDGRPGHDRDGAHGGHELELKLIDKSQHVLKVAAVASVVRLRDGPAAKPVRPVFRLALAQCRRVEQDVVVLQTLAGMCRRWYPVQSRWGPRRAACLPWEDKADATLLRRLHSCRSRSVLAVGARSCAARTGAKRETMVVSRMTRSSAWAGLTDEAGLPAAATNALTPVAKMAARLGAWPPSGCLCTGTCLSGEGGVPGPRAAWRARLAADIKTQVVTSALVVWPWDAVP